MDTLFDSTYFIAAERRGLSAGSALIEARKLVPSGGLGMSVISVMELAHGEARSESPSHSQQRNVFLNQLMSALDIYPVTAQIARRSGLLDGELCKQGTRLAFPDILIGITALELGGRIVTKNLRHFELIPGLTVIKQP